ncbi:MAG: hypothetical protein R3F61_15905 [Myxococcota bacterium]
MCSALWCGPAEALEVREIAHVEGAHLQSPSFSEDGTQLAWEANFHDRKVLHLYVGTPKGAGQRVEPPVRARSSFSKGFEGTGHEGVAHELAWAPRYLNAFVYSATNLEDDYDLYVGTAAIVRSPGADGGAAWSPDGGYIVFASARSGDGDLYLIDVAKIEEPPRQLTSIPRASELHATWSPDSKGLAFVAHGTSGDNLWWLPTLDGAPVQLTNAKGSQLHPRFSPDGHRIAYYANAPGSEQFSLYVMDVKPGSTPRRLLDAVIVDSHGPAWLDEVSLLAVADEDDAFDPVVRVTVAGERSNLPLDTVGNRDLAVVRTETGVRVAWCAQGQRDGLKRDFRRLYTTELSLP